MINLQDPDYKNTPVSKHRTCIQYTLVDKTNPPKVSIITPFYNTGKEFLETAQVVLNQSFQEFEWIIVNDGSQNPESLKILDGFRNIDPRVRVLDHTVNRGPSAARNTGYAAATTDFIVQFDADDLLEPTAIEKWYWMLISHPEYSFVKGYTLGFGSQEFFWKHGFDADLLLSENPATVNCMVRKGVHQTVGGFNESETRGLEDYDFWLHCAAHGFWGGTIPEYQDWYRIRPSHRDKWQNWNPAGVQTFLSNAQKKYPGLWLRGVPNPAEYAQRADLVNGHQTEKLASNSLSKTSKRILMIFPWLRMGGADKFNLDLLKQMTSRGWEVTIVTTLAGDNSWAAEFGKYTSDIFILRNFLKPEDFPRFLVYLLQSRQIDVGFISINVYGFQILPFLRSQCPDVTWTSYCHMEEEDGSFGAYPLWVQENQSLFDLNIVNSEHLKSLMIRHGVVNDRVESCYINISAEEFCPKDFTRTRMRVSLGVGLQEPVIIFVARLCKQKQPFVFLKTIKLLREMNPSLPFKAIVVGDGPDAGLMRSVSAKMGLGADVVFLGALNIRDMRDIYAAADIFFLPSAWEGIALTIFEAMASGLPIVGADVGGQRELVTPECGILISKSSPDQEAQEYARLLANLLVNPELGKKMGQAGKQRVQDHFQITQMGEKMELLFEKAIQMHKDSPLKPVTQIDGEKSAQFAIEQSLTNSTWVEPASPYYYDPMLEETFMYRTIKKILRPFYGVVMKFGGGFVLRVKDQLRKIINKK